MDSAGAGADDSRGAFSLDTIPSLSGGFSSFQREWETQVGEGFPLPTFSQATTGDFRVKGRAAKVRDVAITDVHGASAIRTAALGDVEDQVRMWVVRRGAWTLGGGSGGEHTVSAGQFLLRHVGRPSHFATAPHTTAKIVVLPAAMLRPLLGNRIVTGAADSAEVRLLVAHTNMIHATMADLGPAGVQAAHRAVIELAKAVARHRFDDKEPLLATALAQAAKELADSRLTDPSLSSRTLASELNVSVRTLQRAFAAGGESVTSYIRLRRLEEARLALTAQPGRLSVSELAAHWQFSDSSHFIRAFKSHYGQTPGDCARQARAQGD
ncbi:helix-turn-helix domain-containing protein [Streptomyces sp. NPDC048254]|uniref:helix-turn-helix domain-containing protein n=1 Tax=Streptomyces sp. NPDC048254 TaxID=3365525 RepID=UPI003719FCB2